MTKTELAEKIAKEQHLDAKKLMRLTIAELEKMDLVVADAGADILGGEAPEPPSTVSVDGDKTPANDVGVGEGTSGNEVGTGESEGSTTPELGESGSSDRSRRNPVLVGFDPVSGEEVYQ